VARSEVRKVEPHTLTIPLSSVHPRQQPALYFLYAAVYVLLLSGYVFTLQQAAVLSVNQYGARSRHLSGALGGKSEAYRRSSSTLMTTCFSNVLQPTGSAGGCLPATTDIYCMHTSKSNSICQPSSRMQTKPKHTAHSQWLHMLGCPAPGEPCQPDQEARDQPGNLEIREHAHPFFTTCRYSAMLSQSQNGLGSPLNAAPPGAGGAAQRIKAAG
jgi:hypothetical protein